MLEHDARAYASASSEHDAPAHATNGRTDARTNEEVKRTSESFSSVTRTGGQSKSTVEPYYADDAVTIVAGDCIEVLAGMDAGSVDAVVTDPPYGLEFMGKDWDRPWAVGMSATGYTDGGKRLTRPSHGDNRNPTCRACGGRARGAKRCECETPDWKPTGVGRGVNVAAERSAELTPRGQGHATSGGAYLAAGVDSVRVAGKPFQEWCEVWARECLRVLKPGGYMLAFGGSRTWHRLAAAVEDAGFEIRDSIAWLYGSGFPKSLNIGDGRGTALKPAFEPIVVGRKPLAGTVAANVLQHGTGALNIDACRIESGERPVMVRTQTTVAASSMSGASTGATSSGETTSLGRWPANVVLDDTQAADLDRQTGVLTSGANPTRRGADRLRDAYGEFSGQAECTPARGADSGGASRFFPTFHYEAKAPTAERPRGDDGTAHPTVKPLDLMRWLVRLVTPPGGLVLDPFLGSGTTAEACVMENLRCVGIEREPAYLPLAVARLSKPIAVGFDFGASA